MLKAGRLEVSSNQKVLLILKIMDGCMQEGYQTVDLGNAPRFSGSMDHLVLDRQRETEKNNVPDSPSAEVPRGDSVPIVLPSDHASEECQGNYASSHLSSPTLHVNPIVAFREHYKTQRRGIFLMRMLTVP